MLLKEQHSCSWKYAERFWKSAMRRNRGKHILTTLIVSVIPLVLLSGCHNEEKAKVSRAYYVISEELDVQRTADKAQEILENAESSDKK